MQQAAKNMRHKPSRSNKRRFESLNASSHNDRPPPSFTTDPTIMSGVATPPLSEPVPKDTPRFADLDHSLVHPTLLQTITEDLKFDHMMPVQAATLHELLENKIDCLAQARTGTGKTLSFLLPAVQNMLNTRNPGGSKISLLVMSPTRELAMQISKEANALLQRLPQYRVHFAIGGTNKDREFKNIMAGCDILIATPGRLLDHMQDEMFVYQFRALQTLVLDEADRMLDMGFLPDIKKIIAYLPKKTDVPRQSMLFSATVAGQIENVAHLILKKDYKFISTIPAGEKNTHDRVPQFLVTVPTMSDVAPAMLAAIKAERSSTIMDPFKTIIFAPTAALADFYGLLLSQTPNLPDSFVLHSRISQNERTRRTETFRTATNAICIATDVIARGMDFPGVTHVFQVGVPSDKEAYIHRLGRTARADAEGRGIMILALPEKFFLYQVKEIGFQDLPEKLDFTRADTLGMASRMEEKEKAKIYQAWMGYYKNHVKALKWDLPELVRQANTFAFEALGAAEVPGLQKKTIGKMGLKGVPGLVILANEPGTNDSSRRGGGEGRGIGGGAGREASKKTTTSRSTPPSPPLKSERRRRRGKQLNV